VIDEIHALAEQQTRRSADAALAATATLMAGLKRVACGHGRRPRSHRPLMAAPPRILARSCWPTRSRRPISRVLHTDAARRGPATAPPMRSLRCSNRYASIKPPDLPQTPAPKQIFFPQPWWGLPNEDSLPIGIHHALLTVSNRNGLEAAMVRGDPAGHCLHRQLSWDRLGLTSIL